MTLTLSDFTAETEDVATEAIPTESRTRINDVLEELTEGLGEEPPSPEPSKEVLVSDALDGRPGFESIQDALDGTNPRNGAVGAEPGDTIRIEDGEFKEVVSVSIPDITIVGESPAETTIAGQVDVTATGFTLRETTVRAGTDVTDQTAVLVDDGTGLTVSNNVVVARESGLGLLVKQAPASGTTTVDGNTFQPQGNETAQSLVVIGENASATSAGTVDSLGPVGSVMTDGGTRPRLGSQAGQSQVEGASVAVLSNEFVGNVAGQGAVQVGVATEVNVVVEENDFSETLLFGDDATPVSDQSGSAATVTTANNSQPEPIGQDEGISLPGDNVLNTADFTPDSSKPSLTAADVAGSLVPQAESEGFFMGLYVPTAVDGDSGIPVEASQRGVTAGTTASESAAIAIPESLNDTDSFFSNNPDYTVTIPATLVWNSTFTDEEFGKIAFGFGGSESNASNVDIADKSFPVEQPRGRREVEIEIGYESQETGSTNFRDAGLQLTVDFEAFDADTRLAEVAPSSSLTSTIQYATPNNSVITVGDLIATSAEVYDQGLSLAEEVTKLPDNSVDALRQSARLALYTGVAASDRELAESELVQGATVDGLSAFADKADSVAAFNQAEAFNASDQVAPAGPTVSFLTDAQNIGVKNASFTGDNRSGGAFELAPNLESVLFSPLFLGSGAILSTGKINDIRGPNTTGSNSTQTAGGSDPDLESLDTIDNETNDRAVLEFDLDVPSGVTAVSFRYVFGSEEYNEFTNSTFNDVFAFFVNDENVATVPDPDDPNGTIPASINNINHGDGTSPPTNPQLFINNDPYDGEVVSVDPGNPPGPGIGFDPSSAGQGDEPFPVEMDGFTVPLEVTAPVDPGETNSVKIAIADVGDMIYDSWVLIAAGDITEDVAGSG